MADTLPEAPQGEGEYWISISDLMSGLMVVFLFIAVAYVTNIYVTYERLQTQLYTELVNEFEQDLPRWNAIIRRDDLAMRFREPDVLFDVGSAELKPRFQTILRDFFPRYIRILTHEQYVDEIEEVRIEGHTSSEWRAGTDSLEAYINNMELSQDRTRSVLSYVLNMDRAEARYNWLIRRLTANGLSSSDLIYAAGTNEEDAERSRRVEFRIRLDVEGRLESVIGPQN
jgi:outer membrane protein OmpA-like peptidoglycan-associated protein